MSSSLTVARFKCKHCSILFTKRSNWTRHESNVNVHRKPPRRRPGAASVDNQHSGSSSSGLSPTSSRVQSAPAREPGGLSTRRRSKAAEAAQLQKNDKPVLKQESVHDDLTHGADANPLRITIRPRRSKRPRLSSLTSTLPEENPAHQELHHSDPPPPTLAPSTPRRRSDAQDARNSQFKKWVRVLRHTQWVPGETAPGTPNPLPRQLVRQRAREYAAMEIEPGSKVPEGIDEIYDVDWSEVLQTFDSSVRKNGTPDKSVSIEELGESSTDSDSSLWDSD
ncbi:hypothetical protein BDV93DRAFT_207706 [Ceratobasidium sp. AG-I]|nr:hypothetical protein BDV93DRAFT_207706 [Ceratobasidium sp. AG-I]